MISRSSMGYKMLVKKQRIGGLILSLALIALAGCGGTKQAPPEAPTPVQPAPKPVPLPEPEPEDDSTVVVGDTWELTVPSTVDRKRTRGDALVYAGFDPTAKRLIMLVREEVNGDSATGLTTFSTTVKSSFKDSGFNVISETTGTINGVPFIKVEGFKPPIVLHNWMLVKSGQGYLLGCGGIMLQAAEHAGVCSKIAASLKLK
jgi:hypothetical protein